MDRRLERRLWRDGYTESIPKLREAGIKNTILVDAAGWGQYAKSIGDYGKEVFDSDPDKNTMFAVHMYGTAGKNSSVIKRISDLLPTTGCV
ncbi:MAG: cellulase family glycosylhydrolase [[Eubacterium] siraeum]